MRSLSFVKPKFEQLYYEPILVGEQACLLLSWRLNDADRLCIPALKFKTKARNGSVCLPVGPGTRTLKLRIRNFWRSATLVLRFVRTDFQPSPEPSPKQIRLSRIYRPVLHWQNTGKRPTNFRFRLKNI